MFRTRFFGRTHGGKLSIKHADGQLCGPGRQREIVREERGEVESSDDGRLRIPCSDFQRVFLPVPAHSRGSAASRRNGRGQNRGGMAGLAPHRNSDTTRWTVEGAEGRGTTPSWRRGLRQLRDGCGAKTIGDLKSPERRWCGRRPRAKLAAIEGQAVTFGGVRRTGVKRPQVRERSDCGQTGL